MMGYLSPPNRCIGIGSLTAPDGMASRELLAGVLATLGGRFLIDWCVSSFGAYHTKYQLRHR